MTYDCSIAGALFLLKTESLIIIGIDFSSLENYWFIRLAGLFVHEDEAVRNIFEYITDNFIAHTQDSPIPLPL
jgi:hypothetical protein